MKHAIIVGASSGMGREVCNILLSDGWKIGIAARRESLLEEIKASCPDRVEVMKIDVTAPDAAERLLSLAGRMGGVDLFLYSSGIGKQNNRLDTNIELATIDVNSRGFTAMIDTMFNYMAVHSGGHIAVISSIAGTKGLGAAPSYSATKAFQNTYIQALEQLAYMRGLPIRFTDIRPGFVDTDLLAGSRHYPMLMDKTRVARSIVRAIYSKRHVKVIDMRYRMLVSAWRLIPKWLWRRMKIQNEDTNP